MRSVLRTLLVFSVGCTVSAADDPASVLARILAEKGTINSSELARVESVDMGERVKVLASLLEQKGLLTPGDMDKLARAASSEITAPGRLVPAVMGGAAPQAQPAGPPTPAREAAAAVTSQSKFPVTVYGTLLVNAFFDTSLNNIQDIPLFAGKQ